MRTTTSRTLISLLAVALLAFPCLASTGALATPHPISNGSTPGQDLTLRTTTEPGTEHHSRAGEPTLDPLGHLRARDPHRPAATAPSATHRAPRAAPRHRTPGHLLTPPAGHPRQDRRAPATPTPAELQVFRC
ncbi:hypothetical protein AB0G74_24940 [Streptomyces sp. NPDC020875]|uniref:hypothetical protein n=1 Tax=Streptomyces sp. NPDC020875 TaxID=3154898 RepID=UPI0033DCD1AB